MKATFFYALTYCILREKTQLFNCYRYFTVLYLASFSYLQSLICFYFILSIFTFSFALIRINLMCDSLTRLLRSTIQLKQKPLIILPELNLKEILPCRIAFVFELEHVFSAFEEDVRT